MNRARLHVDRIVILASFGTWLPGPERRDDLERARQASLVPYLKMASDYKRRSSSDSLVVSLDRQSSFNLSLVSLYLGFTQPTNLCHSFISSCHILELQTTAHQNGPPHTHLPRSSDDTINSPLHPSTRGTPPLPYPTQPTDILTPTGPNLPLPR